LTRIFGHQFWAHFGPIDSVAQIPTNRTMSPKRVDCKKQNGELAANCVAKHDLHFHFLLLFNWQSDLMLMTKFAIDFLLPSE
jgi:hypothetical protein